MNSLLTAGVLDLHHPAKYELNQFGCIPGDTCEILMVQGMANVVYNGIVALNHGANL